MPLYHEDMKPTANSKDSANLSKRSATQAITRKPKTMNRFYGMRDHVVKQQDLHTVF